MATVPVKKTVMKTAVSRWTPKELARGTDRYRRYLALFGLTEDTFKYKSVCHVGCGPLGGVLSVLRGVHQAYRVDREADIYRRMGCCPDCEVIRPLHDFRVWKMEAPLLPINRRTGRSPVPSRSCDAVFCLGDVNDTPWLVTLERELRRICKTGGKLYLWWRVSEDTTRHALTADRVRRIFKDSRWAWNTVSQGADLPNLFPAVKAMWTVLIRVQG